MSTSASERYTALPGALGQETPGGPSHAPVGTVPPPTNSHAPGTSSRHHRCTQCPKSAAPVGTQSAAQHPHRRHPGQYFAPLRSAEPAPAPGARRDELTLTPDQPPGEIDQWITGLTAGHRTFADGLADRQTQMIPAEDPDYGDLGPAFPAWTSPGREPILQPPKPEIPPSPQILQRAMDRDAGFEAAD